MVSSLDGLGETAEVDVVDNSLVVPGATDVDVKLAEFAVNPGLWAGLACLTVEAEHVLH